MLSPKGEHTCLTCGEIFENELDLLHHSIDHNREEKYRLPRESNPKPPPNDPVNHPAHYKNHPSGIECIEITRHFNFNRGNAIKYIWRASEKGKEVEDLEKAIWYLKDEINKIKKNIV